MRLSIISVVFLSVFTPPRAAAQVTYRVPAPAGSNQSIHDIRDNYRVRIGPFHVEPAIVLKDLGVDSNVFNQARDAKSDFTLTLAPQAALAVPIGNRALVKSTLGLDLVYFLQYASERSVDPQAVVRGEVYAGRRVTLFMEGAYVNTRERPNYEIDLRARHLDNDLWAGLAFHATTRTSVEVAAGRSKTRFDGDAYFYGQRLQEALDRDTDVYTVTARYKHSGMTSFGVRYENQNDRFIWSPVRDTDSFRVMPGVEFKPKALVGGSAWIGYRSLNAVAPMLPDQSGLVSSLTLSYTLLGATVFGVSYDRDYDYAFEVLTPFFLDNSPGFFVRRAIGGRFDITGNVARHHYSYISLVTEPAPAGPGFQRIDTTDNYGVNVGYQLGRGTRVGVGFSYWTRDSTLPAFRNYDKLRIGMTMSREFQP